MGASTDPAKTLFAHTRVPSPDKHALNQFQSPSGRCLTANSIRPSGRCRQFSMIGMNPLCGGGGEAEKNLGEGREGTKLMFTL